MALSTIYRALTIGDICCSSLLFLFSILALIYYFISDYSYLSQIPDNWNSSLIFPKENENCNNPASVQFGQWPGISYACDCSTDPLSLFQVFRRRCKWNLQERAMCRDINEIAPISYFKWRNINFCRSTVLTNLNYKNLFFENSNSNFFIKSNPNSCLSGSRACGAIDSLGNVLCVNLKYDCPLNFLKFFPANEDLPKDDKNYTKTAADGGAFLLSGDYTKQPIIVDFKVSDAQPCASPYYSNSNSTTYFLELNYSWDKCSKKIGSEEFDKRYAYVDTYSFKALTSQNGVYNLISGLPKYPQDALNKQTALYARSYIGIAPKCLEDLKQSGKAEKFYAEIQNLKNDVWFLFGILIAGMIIAIIHSCIFIVHNCLNLSQSSESAQPGTMLVISFVLFVPALTLKVIAYAQFANTLEKDVLTDANCVDDLTFNASVNYFQKSSTAASFLLVCIFALVYGIVSGFVKFAFKDRIGSVEDLGAARDLMVETGSIS